MKILAYIGIIIGITALTVGLYLQFVVVDQAVIGESIMNKVHEESWYNSTDHIAASKAVDSKTDLGIIVLMISSLGLLVSLFAAIKKQNMAWIGVLGALVALFIGIMYGTHMFS